MPVYKGFDTSNPSPAQKLAYAKSLTPEQRGGLSPTEFVDAWDHGQTPDEYKAKTNFAGLAKERQAQYANTDKRIVTDALAAGYIDPPGGTHGVVAYALRVNANTVAAQKGTGARTRAALTPGVGYVDGPVFKIREDGSIRRAAPTAAINAPFRELSAPAGTVPRSVTTDAIDIIDAIPRAAVQYGGEIKAFDINPNEQMRVPITAKDPMLTRIGKGLLNLPNTVAGVLTGAVGIADNGLVHPDPQDTVDFTPEEIAQDQRHWDNFAAGMKNGALGQIVQAGAQVLTGNAGEKGPIDNLLGYGGTDPIAFGVDLGTSTELFHGVPRTVAEGVGVLRGGLEPLAEAPKTPAVALPETATFDAAELGRALESAPLQPAKPSSAISGVSMRGADAPIVEQPDSGATARPAMSPAETSGSPAMHIRERTPLGPSRTNIIVANKYANIEDLIRSNGGTVTGLLTGYDRTGTGLMPGPSGFEHFFTSGVRAGNLPGNEHLGAAFSRQATATAYYNSLLPTDGYLFHALLGDGSTLGNGDYFDFVDDELQRRIGTGKVDPGDVSYVVGLVADALSVRLPEKASGIYGLSAQ